MRLGASLRMLTPVLAFHRRAAKAFWTSALAATMMALMWRVPRTTLSFALADSVRAVLRIARAFGARGIAILRTVWTLLAGALGRWRWGLGSSRWWQRGCRRKRRRDWGFGILG